jgi:hypothetical protein
MLKASRDWGGARRISSFRFDRRRAPFARQQLLQPSHILAKPPRPRRLSNSSIRFALFNAKRDIPSNQTLAARLEQAAKNGVSGVGLARQHECA